MHVLIIGAGTGGLALAHKLKQAGIGVSVHERDPVPNADTGGYRVGISLAGTMALKDCVSADHFELFVATSAQPPRNITLLTEKLSRVLRFDMEGLSEDAVNGEKNVIRKTLRRVLLRGLEDKVLFGNAFEGYSNNPDGRVTAHFRDGSTATGDVLVGADGTGSAVRKQRLPDARLEDTGMGSFGGKLPMTAQTRALLSPEMLRGMSMIMAPGGFGAVIHSLQFLTRRTDPAFIARWPDFVDALDDDSIGWGLWGARQNYPQDPANRDGAQLKEIGLAVTRGWAPRFRTLIEMTDASAIHYVGIRTSVTPEPWETSNVTLLGDAIHTMTPGRGAGANTALRDAALLGNLLIDAHHGRRALLGAIHDYEAEMLRYSAEAVRASKKQMSADDSIHKPILGGIQLGMIRAGMRLVDALPPVKRRILQGIMRVRGEN